MSFEGWTEDDFAVFEIEGFEERMPALKARLTPKLKAIGEALAPRLRAETGLEFHAKVAQHMRRRVNPPEETWVAFSRNTRGYKPYVHLRVSVNAEAAKVVCHVDDDADDLPAFGSRLKKRAAEMAAFFAAHPQVRCYNLRSADGEPLSGAALDRKALVNLSARLPRLRGEHIHFAIRHPRAEAVAMRPEAFLDTTLKELDLLLPLYGLGLP
jgi:uncharacterized protein YktB (UPF0637 family)